MRSNRIAPTGPIANGFAASGVLPLAHRRFTKMKNTRFPGAVSDDRAPNRAQRLYNLFGECRFGFEAALREWPENPEA